MTAPDMLRTVSQFGRASCSPVSLLKCGHASWGLQIAGCVVTFQANCCAPCTSRLGESGLLRSPSFVSPQTKNFRRSRTKEKHKQYSSGCPTLDIVFFNTRRNTCGSFLGSFVILKSFFEETSRLPLASSFSPIKEDNLHHRGALLASESPTFSCLPGHRKGRSYSRSVSRGRSPRDSRSPVRSRSQASR